METPPVPQGPDPIPAAALATLESGVNVRRCDPNVEIVQEFEHSVVYKLWRSGARSFTAWHPWETDAGLWYTTFEWSADGNVAQEARKFIPWASLAGATVAAVAPVLDNEPF